MKTVKAVSAKKSSINSIAAQAGELVVTVQTKAASAKALKSCAPLAAAMNETGEETSAELLSRLPQNTVAFKVFSQNALGTAQLFAWFDDNQPSLTRTTREGKLLLNMAGAYVSAFGISHNRATDGPLKNMPFYKRFSNALQQWAKRKGGFDTRPSGSITDPVAAYLDKKLSDNAEALSDSLTAWIFKNEYVLQRILDSKAA